MILQEFKRFEGKLGTVEIDTTASHKRVREIERSNWVIKEQSRAISTTLPYAVFPKQFVIYMIYYVVTFLNRNTAMGSNLSPPLNPVLRAICLASALYTYLSNTKKDSWTRTNS